jgi:CDP-diacylglycerol--serine O-phosphatidyltransferase
MTGHAALARANFETGCNCAQAVLCAYPELLPRETAMKLGASLGGGEWWLRASVLFYILAALIRLAYFNVTEEERQSATNEHRHYYLGVPVTAASFVMPLFWALPLRLGSALAVIYAVGLTLLAFLFIAPLRIPKPGLKGILCMILLGAAELYLMFYGAMPL